jgi:small-conductance mechanosensitive channel
MGTWDSAAWRTLEADLVTYLPRLALAVLVLLGCWAVGSGARRVINRLARAHALESGLILFLGQSAKITLLLLGLVTALGTLGVNVTALVTGLGLTGFALGFAMKDMLSNALSGFLVLFYKPFGNGDRIEVTSLQGTVVEVNFRYTVLDAEGKWIYIPNANLFSNPVLVTKRKTLELG